MKAIRKGNIECRKYAGGKFYEIIHWYPNHYYGKLDQYLQDGYELSFLGGFVEKGGHNIDITFFTGSPENCYVLAWVKKDSEGSWYMTTIGDRPLELSDEDFHYFVKVYKESGKKLNKMK